MIDKLLFDRPMNFNGKDAFGVLMFTPYPDPNESIKFQLLDKDGLPGNEIWELPFESLVKFRKIFQKIIKGEYDTPVDNSEVENEESDIFMSQ